MNNNKKNNAYGELELVFPTKEYKNQVEEYLQEFLENGENEIAGDGGLDRIKDFDKWLEKIQKDLSVDTIDKDRIPSTVYLTKSGVRIDIWTHFMRGCIIDYVH